MPPSGDIYPLPPDVVAKIKSSTSITHLNGVVIELVKNALDANARTVLISVDFKRGSCIVEDDGDGIPRAEFEVDGGLGKAHHTSKFQSTSAYGHKGLFLASLASLSLVTVTSRHLQDATTSSVIFHHSKPVARLIPAPAHQNIRVGDHGTCVTVNDLFGNMPVRVKSRALALQRSDELEREWDSLRYSLVSLLLCSSQLSKLTFTDVERGKRFSIRPKNNNSVRNELDLERIGSILVQSGMIASRSMDAWHILSATVPDLSICAAISTMPSPSKKLQFISLGKEPVLPRNGSNLLFNEVNRLISLSDFGNTLSRDTSASVLSPVPGRSETSMTSRSWPKPVNKWPMFYVRIETSSAQSLCDDTEDVSPDSEKPLQRILDVLGVMIVEFLKQQKLRPRVSKRQTRSSERDEQSKVYTGQRNAETVVSFKKGADGLSAGETFGSRVRLPAFQRSQTVSSSPHFDGWSRVKSAKDLTNQTSEPQDRGNATNSQDLRENMQSRFLPERPRGGTRQHEENTSEAPTNDHIPWTDPQTGKRHMINGRTGQTLDPQDSSFGPRMRSGSRFAAPHTESHPETSRPDSTPATNSWVNNLLNAWENPTFRRTELPISNLEIGTDYLNAAGSSHNCLHSIDSLDATHVARFRGKLHRNSLAEATIIAQVDQKFILTKIEIGASEAGYRDSENVLVLVDQHAADERCRVEQLFEEMFLPMEESGEFNAVRTTEVDSITFSVGMSEQALFRKYLGFFGKWGVQYAVETTALGGTISVTTLPLLIAERCRLEHNVVIDLLRREIWTSEEDDRGPHNPSNKSLRTKYHGHGSFPFEDAEDAISENTSSHQWVQKMSGCPQGIIDLLNSRACRGAIMFNDPLSIDECNTLLSRLSRCAFPFQCAHGRPSMVPILDLRPEAETRAPVSDARIMAHEHEHDELGFLQAFKQRYGS
ncbi:hypothetical protein N7532_007558 [Penicillium argentinense]|uniref:MutL C-terminal dimerisation domain-containing protein n=1 Tax=Penicillium argentinense TaxID=1131581 RepID=A0A9W9K7R4_9EURO|nr:uncharacterized protein N7532_007558 [Penicillium argentinense]KAJ5095267.1 hypothetical protein N7532_007558 [Penicillium argentinense]